MTLTIFHTFSGQVLLFANSDIRRLMSDKDFSEFLFAIPGSIIMFVYIEYRIWDVFEDVEIP